LFLTHIVTNTFNYKYHKQSWKIEPFSVKFDSLIHLFSSRKEVETNIVDQHKVNNGSHKLSVPKLSSHKLRYLYFRTNWYITWQSCMTNKSSIYVFSDGDDEEHSSFHDKKTTTEMNNSNQSFIHIMESISREDMNFKHEGNII
jgi:hypothetical protein